MNGFTLIQGNWCDQLDMYTHQYNTGAHQGLGGMSPFEVFFGRKFNDHIHEIEPGEHSQQVGTENLREWSEHVDHTRKVAEEKSKKISERMVERHREKNPPSTYDIDERVMVKIQKGKKKLKSSTFTTKARVKEKKNDGYVVEYEKDGKTVKTWLPVSCITAETRTKEILKQRSARAMANRAEEVEEIPKIAEQIQPKSSDKPNDGKVYNLRKRKISNYHDLDTNFHYQQYRKDLEKAMEISRRENVATWDLTEIQNELLKRQLEVVDVLGDGNCFYHAVAHQLFGDADRDVEVRKRALRYIANHAEEFVGFEEDLEDEMSLERLLRQNRRDGEYADNLMVQATANAYRISIEVITSDRTYLTTNIITPRDPLLQHLVIGNINQVHYVSSRPTLPYFPWGGFSSHERAALRNTCPIDGPLTWLFNALKSYEQLKNDLIANLPGFSETINLREAGGTDGDAKLTWLRSVANLNIEKPLNCYGSAAEQFFEPLSRSSVGKITKSSICSSDNCPTNEMTEEYEKYRKFTPLFNNGYARLQDRIQEAFNPKETICSICTKTRKEKTDDLPSLIIVPGDHCRFGEGIPTSISIMIGNVVHIFIAVLITIQKNARHFTAKIKTNDHFWFAFDSLKQPYLKLEKLAYLNLQKVGFIVYIKKSLTNFCEIVEPTIQCKSAQPDIDYDDLPASSCESSTGAEEMEGYEDSEIDLVEEIPNTFTVDDVSGISDSTEYSLQGKKSITSSLVLSKVEQGFFEFLTARLKTIEDLLLNFEVDEVVQYPEAPNDDDYNESVKDLEKPLSIWHKFIDESFPNVVRETGITLFAKRRADLYFRFYKEFLDKCVM